MIDCAERMGQYCFVMVDELEDYARTELEKAGAPEMLIDCGVFDLKDLKDFAEDSLDQNGYVPDFTGCVYIKPRQQEHAMTTDSQSENIITRHSSHIKIEGYQGTWSVIAETKSRPEAAESQPLTPCFLLEHEEYGDEAAGLIVDEKGNILLDEVWNGFSDLEEAGWEVESEDISQEASAGTAPRLEMG